MHLVGMVCVTIDPSHVSFLVALNRPNPRQGRIVAVSFFGGETPQKKSGKREGFGCLLKTKEEKEEKTKQQKLVLGRPETGIPKSSLVSGMDQNLPSQPRSLNFLSHTQFKMPW